LRGTWEDPSVGSLTLVSITTHKEADSEQKHFTSMGIGIAPKTKEEKKRKKIGISVNASLIQYIQSSVPQDISNFWDQNLVISFNY